MFSYGITVAVSPLLFIPPLLCSHLLDRALAWSALHLPHPTAPTALYTTLLPFRASVLHAPPARLPPRTLPGLPRLYKTLWINAAHWVVYDARGRKTLGHAAFVAACCMALRHYRRFWQTLLRWVRYASVVFTARATAHYSCGAPQPPTARQPDYLVWLRARRRRILAASPAYGNISVWFNLDVLSGLAAPPSLTMCTPSALPFHPSPRLS